MQRFAAHPLNAPAASAARTLEKQKALVRDEGFRTINSLTMSYFHTGIRTIIGAESFHCPVRDGKEWDQLAMVIRLNRLLPRMCARQPICRVDGRTLVFYRISIF
jgi:hypothetical protein